MTKINSSINPNMVITIMSWVRAFRIDVTNALIKEVIKSIFVFDKAFDDF